MKTGTVDATQLTSPTVKWDRRTLVTKSTPIRYEITSGTDGGRTDIWYDAGCAATLAPGQAAPSFVLQGANRGLGADVMYSDYSKSDFKGFDWISRGNYIGIQNLSGSNCYVFQSPVDPKLAAATAATPGIAAVIPTDGSIAFIIIPDPNKPPPPRRLPLLLKDDTGITLYTWEPTPSAPVVLPPAVQNFITGLQARIKAATAPAPAP
jgi:hypothetical protein